MTINTRGLDAIRAGLPGAIEAGVVRGAGFIQDLAQQLSPVDTGALRASIHVAAGDTQTSRKVVAGGGAVDYAAYVEYGTSRSPAQPYMTPAARAINVQQEVASEVRALIGRSRA
jgi:HK97 gp10 family phage protein